MNGQYSSTESGLKPVATRARNDTTDEVGVSVKLVLATCCGGVTLQSNDDVTRMMTSDGR